MVANARSCTSEGKRSAAHANGTATGLLNLGRRLAHVGSLYRHAGRASVQKKVKLADKRDSVVNGHSSRPRVAPRLQPPTRRLRGSHQRLPIWCCSGWRLPRFTLSRLRRERPAAKAARPSDRPKKRPLARPSLRALGRLRCLRTLPSFRTLSPRFRAATSRERLVSVALFLASRRLGVTQHPTLWSPDFPLTGQARQRPSGQLREG